MYSCSTELFEIELTICIKMDLALNNLQRLICHKPNQPTMIWVQILNKAICILIKANTLKKSINRWSSHGVVANELDCEIIVSSNCRPAIMFTFWLIPLGKMWNPLFHSYGVNSTTIVLLQGRLWWVSLSLIVYSIHMVLCHIWAKSIANYYKDGFSTK